MSVQPTASLGSGELQFSLWEPVGFKNWICFRSCRLRIPLQRSRLLSCPPRLTFDPFRLGLVSVAGWVALGHEKAGERQFERQAEGVLPG